MKEIWKEIWMWPVYVFGFLAVSFIFDKIGDFFYDINEDRKRRKAMKKKK